MPEFEVGFEFEYIKSLEHKIQDITQERDLLAKLLNEKFEQWAEMMKERNHLRAVTARLETEKQELLNRIIKVTEYESKPN
jgi:hypothetical protein